ncbi:MAG TPA: xanthine dehydrogenase family protein subunit M [Trebonia sp.]|nr:xanthine dehydrogenase family protein subunit M [Trebonia sp.]
MIPASFTYHRASSVDEALSMAAQLGEDAKFLAGGHSLLPMMKLRFAVPTDLIDVGRITELSYIRDEGTYLAIGALTRHHEVTTSPLLATQVPLLAHAAGQVGDPQIRHRGTIGGSVAHADAASDLPAVLLALDATFVIQGADGARSVPVGEFFKSIFETALQPGELLTEIQVPKPAVPSAWSFQKFTKRAIDWAIVGVAVQLSPGGATPRTPRGTPDGEESVSGVQGAHVALINMGLTPLRASATEAALASGAPVADAAALAAEGTSPGSDLHASAAFRAHLARVLVRRALQEAGGR